MKKQVFYKDDIGQTIDISLEEDGAAVDLTSATIAIVMNATGSDIEEWSHTASVDSPATNGLAHYDTVSGDLATAGFYYTLVTVTWTSGDVKTYVGPVIEIVEENENLVTVSEFLQFIDMAPENAKSDDTIKDYLENAESLVNAEIPSIAETTNVKFIKQKKSLIILKAAILYFMNMDESHIDPNKRLPKLAFWQAQYSLAADKLNMILASTSTGSASVRRVKSADYSDPNSPYYQG